MSHIPDHVEHPDGWLRGKDARIKANANKTRRRKLEALLVNDSEEFRCWLFDLLPPHLELLRTASQTEFELYDDEQTSAQRVYRKALTAWHKRVGYVPDRLRAALEEWGGLSEKQLEWARKEFNRNVARADGLDAKENARRANAPKWEAGRRFVAGTIQSARIETMVYGRGPWASETTVCKSLILLDDGRKVWTSLPKDAWTSHQNIGELKGTRIELTCSIEPSDDDPTMAFGKRPVLGDTTKKPKREKAPKAPANRATLPADAKTPAPAGETKAEAKARRARERRAKRKQTAETSTKEDTTSQM